MGIQCHTRRGESATMSSADEALVAIVADFASWAWEGVSTRRREEGQGSIARMQVRGGQKKREQAREATHVVQGVLQ